MLDSKLTSHSTKQHASKTLQVISTVLSKRWSRAAPTTRIRTTRLLAWIFQQGRNHNVHHVSNRLWTSSPDTLFRKSNHSLRPTWGAQYKSTEDVERDLQALKSRVPPRLQARAHRRKWLPNSCSSPHFHLSAECSYDLDEGIFWNF